MAVKKIPKNIKFEEALTMLEEAVAQMESGEMPLEDAIETFKQGTELSRICLEKLNTARQEVQKLVVDEEDDSFVTEPFEELEED